MNPKEGKEGEKEKKKKDGQIESKNMTVITYISIDLSGVHVIYIYNYIKCIWTKQYSSNDYQIRFKKKKKLQAASKRHTFKY